MPQKPCTINKYAEYLIELEHTEDNSRDLPDAEANQAVNHARREQALSAAATRSKAAMKMRPPMEHVKRMTSAKDAIEQGVVAHSTALFTSSYELSIQGIFCVRAAACIFLSEGPHGDLF